MIPPVGVVRPFSFSLSQGNNTLLCSTLLSNSSRCRCWCDRDRGRGGSNSLLCSKLLGNSSGTTYSATTNDSLLHCHLLGDRSSGSSTSSDCLLHGHLLCNCSLLDKILFLGLFFEFFVSARLSILKLLGSSLSSDDSLLQSHLLSNNGACCSTSDSSLLQSSLLCNKTLLDKVFFLWVCLKIKTFKCLR
jgi:hypothetical protein